MTTLHQLTQNLVKAEEAQKAWLAGRYPKGTRIKFFFMHGQRNPSTGLVVGHEASTHGGSVRVQHDQAKKHSRYACRDVSVGSIIE